MRTIPTVIFLFLIRLSFAQDDSIIYPSAPKADIKDTIWGEVVNDPYRPLETDNQQRQEWLKQEEQLTKSYFKKHKDKLVLEDDYQTIASTYFNIPHHQGPYYIEWLGNAENGVVSIYYKKALKDQNRKLLLSPTTVDKGLKRFSSVSLSEDGLFLAYTYTKNGSDWQEIGVYDVKNDRVLLDHIQNVKFSGINWLGNGFYYSRFDSVNEIGRYLDVQKNQKVYYHKVGSLGEDKLIYENQENPLSTFRVETLGNRFLLIYEGDLIKLKNVKENSPFYTLKLKKDCKFSILGANGDYLYATTDYPDAYNGSIVEFTADAPSHWEVIVPNQNDFLMKDAIYADHKFFTVYEHNFQQYILIYSDSGDKLKQVDRILGSNTKLVAFSSEENSIILSENFFFCPPLGELLSLKDYEISYISKTHVNFDPLKYTFSVAEYKSKDNTAIPIYIVLDKNYEKKGPRPTLLNFYGGFGITPDASFDPGLILFLNNGGVFAFANVRGGANSVKNWHKMGSLLNKQNTIDDVYYAARFLVNKGLSDSCKIAITGGSNGGLVGAAVVNQHPNYFKAALLMVGAYDMIRSEKYTVGAYNTTGEFGTINDLFQFRNLLSYSPIHNIKPNTQYPSMLIMTADYDDRVPPLHSYKYVAALQELTKSKRPILLNVEKNEGHNLQSFEKQIGRNRYFYSFLFKELGMKYRGY